MGYVQQLLSCHEPYHVFLYLLAYRLVFKKELAQPCTGYTTSQLRSLSYRSAYHSGCRGSQP